VAAQKALDAIAPAVKKVDGVKSTQRVVCGGCLDFKVVTSLTADKFGDWEEAGFAPEADFIKALEGIDGITLVETQTYTVRCCKSLKHCSYTVVYHALTLHTCSTILFCRICQSKNLYKFTV
jgi:hypothetical protein